MLYKVKTLFPVIPDICIYQVDKVLRTIKSELYIDNEPKTELTGADYFRQGCKQSDSRHSGEGLNLKRLIILLAAADLFSISFLFIA